MTPTDQELIEQLASDDPLLRRDAARELGERRTASAVPALIAALSRPMDVERDTDTTDHPEHTSRAAAAVALGLIGDPSAASALLDVIDDGFNLGTAASTALGRLKPPPIDRLVEATRDTGAYRRARAVAALGEIGDRSAFDAMVVLLDDSDDVVSRAAASAFEKMRDPRAVGPLVRLLESANRSSFVRGYAAMTLGALKDPVSVEPLLAALDSDEVLLRRSAARALCRIDDERSRDRLAAIAADDPDRTIRQIVTRYLEPRPGQRQH